MAAFSTASADTNSARYKFEGNNGWPWTSRSATCGPETIRFEWPATLMRD